MIPERLAQQRKVQRPIGKIVSTLLACTAVAQPSDHESFTMQRVRPAVALLRCAGVCPRHGYTNQDPCLPYVGGPEGWSCARLASSAPGRCPGEIQLGSPVEVSDGCMGGRVHGLMVAWFIHVCRQMDRMHAHAYWLNVELLMFDA